MREDKIKKAFKQWKIKMKGNHIKAICKPCWELNYCPYGSLVESFPLSDDDEYRCRIFGHECPVFFVSEPFTETKQMRNISRNIPQIVKLKVFRRDNGVCQVCGKNIPFDEINYDHIIPWSKGGSSDERNIRMLCETCNKKRNNNFEGEYLVAHMQENFHEPSNITLDMLEDLLHLFLLWITMRLDGSEISEEDFCSVIHIDDMETDRFMHRLICGVAELLESEIPFIKVKKKMDMLRYRWGTKDSHIHSINEMCSKFKENADYYVEIEMLLLRQLGFVLEKKYRTNKEYYDLKVSLDEYLD